MKEVKFVVYGKAVGKERARIIRSGGKSWAYTPQKTSTYEEFIGYGYVSVAKGITEEDLRGAIKVEIICDMKRPKKKTMEEPMVKPDIDNIAKCIMDGLAGVAYYDDRQVVKLDIIKIYGHADSVMVKITYAGPDSGQIKVKEMKR